MAKTVVTLPRTSLTMDEGRVLAWHVKEGQAVNQGDPLCDLETDKATVELEAPVTGYVRRILAPAGEALPVGEPLAVLTETADEPLDDEPSDAAGAPAAGAAGGSAASAAAPAAAAAAADGAAALAPEAAAGPRWRASPAARRLARARGVDLAHVRGSGPAGRILRRDVEAALAAVPGVLPSSLAHGVVTSSSACARRCAAAGAARDL
ncbi:MAG: E3 binding domain-containing protein [Firmicutes bacterium]|nr:E3 binding domain-containing protein [Bacillota bacterium]